MRIYELAKNLGVTNDAVIRRCKELDIDANQRMASLSDDDVDILTATINADVKGKTGTKPWNADGGPWSLDLLKVRGSRPGFKIRWTTAGGLQRKLEQGWQLAKRSDYGGVTDSVVGEESAAKEGSMIKRRELILIEISDELFQEREKFFRNKTDKRSVDAKRIATEQAAKIEGMELTVDSTVK